MSLSGLADQWDHKAHFAKGPASAALRCCAADLREALRLVDERCRCAGFEDYTVGGVRCAVCQAYEEDSW